MSDKDLLWSEKRYLTEQLCLAYHEKPQNFEKIRTCSKRLMELDWELCNIMDKESRIQEILKELKNLDKIKSDDKDQVWVESCRALIDEYRILTNNKEKEK